MNQLDPLDFVISRKRKKYRFAKFFNSPLCFEFDQWTKRAVDVVEVGAGDGLFSVEMASRNPNKVFVALDVKADRLQRGAGQAKDRNLTNIFFIRARADQLELLFAERSLQKIWLTFPDPFPKQRSAKHRLTHPNYLESYGKLLIDDGELFLKHDNNDFFQWSLEQFVERGWRIDSLSFDLHESEFYGDAKIMTTYESRWLADGRTVRFVGAKKS